MMLSLTNLRISVSDIPSRTPTPGKKKKIMCISCYSRTDRIKIELIQKLFGNIYIYIHKKESKQCT